MKDFTKNLNLIALFKGIDEADIQPLLSCLSAKTEHYKKNEIVFMAGERIVRFGIVLSGQIQVVQEDYFGNRSILANLDPGDQFGESFACTEMNILPVSVLTIIDSEVLFIDCRKLASPCAKACSYHSKLIQNMLSIVSMKNILLTQKIELTSKRTTREKLLAYLSIEAQKSKSSRFKIPFNRQELADYLSVDRSAMSFALCKLRDEGVLKFNKNKFEILGKN
ncbi:MAG: Crp/Fnr family transcriptional regulator [Saccharofermentanales bacterium]